MAGMAGFEPAHTGTKNRCLTTWRHPIVLIKLQFINKSSLIYLIIFAYLLLSTKETVAKAPSDSFVAL